MTAIESAIATLIREHRLIDTGQRVLVAASGGPDSTALLHLLARLLPERCVAAAYLDHRLRDSAATTAESSLVASLCGRLGVSFFQESIDVPAARKDSGESIEACARRLRYQALERLRQAAGAALIAVGHTADDQVEEVLLRLVRGTGARGLSGMRLQNGRIIRPLLQTSKAQLLEYLESSQVPFCRDLSNESERFRRNRVRHQLLPLLERRFNPAIRSTLLHTASILEEEDDFLARETDRQVQALVEPQQPVEGSASKAFNLDTPGFVELPAALQRRVLEKLCWQSGSRPSFTAIEALRALARNGRIGAEYHLPGRVLVSRETHRLCFRHLPDRPLRRHRTGPAAGFELIVDRPGDYRIDQLGHHLRIRERSCRSGISETPGLIVDRQRVSFPLLLRTPLPGETFRPLGAPGRKKINRYLSDRKIPRGERHRFPVLTSGDAIVAVPGLAISDWAKVTEATRHCLEIVWE